MSGADLIVNFGVTGISDVTSQIDTLSNSFQNLQSQAQSASGSVSGNLGQIDTAGGGVADTLNQKVGPSMSSLVSPIVGLVTGVIGIAAGFVEMERSGTMVDRMNKMVQVSQNMYNNDLAKYNALVAAGKGDTEQAIALKEKLTTDLEGLSVAQQRATEAEQMHLIGMAQFGAGIVQVGVSAGTLVSKLGDMTGGISAVGLLTNPVTLIILGLAAAYLALHFNVGGVTTALEQFGLWLGNVVPALRPVLTGIQDIAATIGIGSKDVNTASQEIGLAIAGIVQTFVAIPGEIQKALGGIGSWLTTDVLNPIEKGWSALQQALGTFAADPLGTIEKVIGDATAWFKTTLLDPLIIFGWNVLQAGFNRFVATPLDAIAKVFGNVVTWFTTNITDKFMQGWQTLQTDFNAFTAHPLDFIAKVFGDISSWFSSNIIGPFMQGWGTLMTDFNSFVSNPLKAIIGVFGVISSWFATNIIDPFMAGWGVLMKDFDTFASDPLGAIQAVFQPVTDWFTGTFIPGLSNAWNNFVSAIAGGAGRIGEAIGSIGNNLPSISGQSPQVAGQQVVPGSNPNTLIGSQFQTGGGTNTNIQGLQQVVPGTSLSSSAMGLSPTGMTMSEMDVLRNLVFPQTAQGNFNQNLPGTATQRAAVQSQANELLNTPGSVPPAQQATMLGIDPAQLKQLQAQKDAYGQAQAALKGLISSTQGYNQALQVTAPLLQGTTKAWIDGASAIIKDTDATTKILGALAPINPVLGQQIALLQNWQQANLGAAQVIGEVTQNTTALRGAFISGEAAAASFFQQTVLGGQKIAGEMAEYQSLDNELGLKMPLGMQNNVKNQQEMIAAFVQGGEAAQTWRNTQIAAMSGVSKAGEEMGNAIAKAGLDAKTGLVDVGKGIASLPVYIQNALNALPTFAEGMKKFLDFRSTITTFSQELGAAMDSDLMQVGGNSAKTLIDNFSGQLTTKAKAMIASTSPLMAEDGRLLMQAIGDKSPQEMATVMSKIGDDTAKYGADSLIPVGKILSKSLADSINAAMPPQLQKEAKAMVDALASGIQSNIASAGSKLKADYPQFFSSQNLQPALDAANKGGGSAANAMGQGFTVQGTTALTVAFNKLSSDIIGATPLIISAIQTLVRTGFVNSLQLGMNQTLTVVETGFKTMTTDIGTFTGGMVNAMQNFVRIGLINSLEKGVSEAVTLVDSGFLGMMNQVGTHLGGMVIAVQKFVTDGLVNSLQKGTDNALALVNKDFSTMVSDVAKAMGSIESTIQTSIAASIRIIGTLVTAINAVPTAHKTVFTAIDDVSSVARNVTSSINAVPTSHTTVFTVITRQITQASTVFVSPTTNTAFASPTTNVMPYAGSTGGPITINLQPAPIYLDGKAVGRQLKKTMFDLSAGVT